MFRTNLAYAENQMNLKEKNDMGIVEVANTVQHVLPESTWHYIVHEMKTVFRFTRKETKWFKNCKTAKLIATIPFAAGCNEPERTAIAHLMIYIGEIKGFQKYYAHLPSDDEDLFQRLAFISTFQGGDQKIIEHGMNLLALIMIEGYHRSEEEDRENGVYNPFVSGAWDYERIKKDLIIKKRKDSNFSLFFCNYNMDSWIM
ncbi:MAG: hypothetical protein IJ688_03715 [Treponema sp.]|nr:hypothetical protein [Treponema sp.]